MSTGIPNYCTFVLTLSFTGVGPLGHTPPEMHITLQSAEAEVLLKNSYSSSFVSCLL
jgi:hypothetical protein